MGPAVAQFGTNLEEDLQLLDNRLKQLKNEYDQYFMGSRKREPQLLRGDVNRMVNYYSNVPIQNTAQRFKFNNLRARYFSFRRHWDETLRKIEEGRYERHLFKANLRDRERNEAQQQTEERAIREEAPRPGGRRDATEALFERYSAAREKTGQGTAGLTREKLDALVKKQTAAIRSKYGVAKVRFKVVVEGGKAKLKATPVKR